MQIFGYFRFFFWWLRRNKRKKTVVAFIFFYLSTYDIMLCKNLFFRRPLLVQVVAGSGATCQCRTEGLGVCETLRKYFRGYRHCRRTYTPLPLTMCTLLSLPEITRKCIKWKTPNEIQLPSAFRVFPIEDRYLEINPAKPAYTYQRFYLYFVYSFTILASTSNADKSTRQ